jgi:hypothetical protein
LNTLETETETHVNYSQQVGPNTPTPLPEPSETINLRNYNDKSQKDNCHNFRTPAGVFELADVADCENKTKQKRKQN